MQWPPIRGSYEGVVAYSDRVPVRWARRKQSIQLVSSMLVCLYEDRPNQVTGLKILLLSLEQYCPTWPVRLQFPGIADSFRTWLRRFSQVSLCEERLPSSGSYNVKPSVLLDGLASGAESCFWLDTDVFVNGNLDFVAAIPPEAIVVAQDPWEYLDGSTHRSNTWGLAAGRSLPGPLNTAAVRVTQQHKELLNVWQRVVITEEYLAEQAKPVPQRNQHMLGDQDALSALLASKEGSSAQGPDFLTAWSYWGKMSSLGWFSSGCIHFEACIPASRRTSTRALPGVCGA
jgi:hypothetical protein